MKTALPESVSLFHSILTDKQMSLIEETLNETNENKNTYSTDLLWELDKEISGIGGYCIPCDPKFNPCHGGEYRELFRSLQS